MRNGKQMYQIMMAYKDYFQNHLGKDIEIKVITESEEMRRLKLENEILREDIEFGGHNPDVIIESAIEARKPIIWIDECN